MEYRYFKMKWEHPLVQEKMKEASHGYALRNKKLISFFDELDKKGFPFVFKRDWYGTPSSAAGFIVTPKDCKMEELKGCKVDFVNFDYKKFAVLTADKRYKKGKILNSELEKLNAILSDKSIVVDTNDAFLEMLGLNGYLVLAGNAIRWPRAGRPSYTSEWLIVEIPLCKDGNLIKDYSIHPDLIEIKQSEFLALQGL